MKNKKIKNKIKNKIYLMSYEEEQIIEKFLQVKKNRPISFSENSLS
jgi:hypothetical protein